MADQIRYSSIVHATVVDQYGENEKGRYNLVIEVDDATCFALGISSSVNFDRLSEYQIKLPDKTSGRCHTGLPKPSVVCCNWVVKIPLDECTHCGFVPGKLMPPIMDALNRYLEEKGLPVSAVAKARK